MAELKKDKPTLLYMSNGFCAYGGGNCVLAWSLEGLREDWNITLFCSYVPEFKSINKHFGTSLEASDFTIKRLPFPLNHVDKIDPDPFSAQRLAWLMRFAQSISARYDMVMTCDDEFDFGRPGIQYTHFPHMQRHIQAFQEIDHLSGGQLLWKFLTGKLRPWLLISRIRISRIKQNLMVTNSNWTADVLREIYGVEATVVYPPVRWGGAMVPWDKRRDAFVCLGRLSPSKRLLEVIEIIRAVREKGYRVELEIMGDEDAIAGQAYISDLKSRIKGAGDWVRLRQSVSRAELERLVSECRYGIHGMLDEHFGIAPAELMRAGCIVFVPDSGGQVEIVGEHPELRYDTDADAVDKICSVLANRDLESRLREELRGRTELFSENSFMTNIRKVVTGFYEKIK